MFTTRGPPAPPDADDVSRAVGEAQLPAGRSLPAWTGDRDFPDEPARPLTDRLVLHDRLRPARGRPARAGSGRGRDTRVAGGGRQRYQPPAGAGRRQALVAGSADAALDLAGLAARRGCSAITEAGLG